MILEWYMALALLIGLVVGLMMLGVPVAFAFMATNLICAYIFMGDTFAFYQVVDNSTSLITRFQLAPVPFFILMGSLFFYSGIAQRVFTTLDILMGRIPGRLCFLTVGGGALFSTLTGSSMANTAMLGSMMVPEMERRGYHWRMSLGPILGTGGLAMVIPPSTLGVLLATIAGLDVGAFLIAGILPGVLLAILYTAVIAVQVWWNPNNAPEYDVPPVPMAEKFHAFMVNIVPMGFCCVHGGRADLAGRRHTNGIRCIWRCVHPDPDGRISCPELRCGKAGADLDGQDLAGWCFSSS